MRDLAPHELTASAAAALIAKGALTSEMLVTDCLEAIGRDEPRIRAFAFIDAEMALAEARRCDRMRPASPLHGIPVAIKDVFDTASMPTEFNSPIYRGRRPPFDSACVARLRRAGAVVIGKTVTAEFAHVAPGSTTNPRKHTHSPGGSSSGSAAAVAASFVPLALGSQTGGSTIRPASYCGVFGFKPTYGHIPTSGLKLLAPSLDTVGLFARCPEDLASFYTVLAQPIVEEAPRESAPLRIGMFAAPEWGEASGSSARALCLAADLLREMECQVSEARLSSAFASLPTDTLRLLDAELAQSLACEYDAHRSLLSPHARAAVEAGRSVSAEELARLRALQNDCAAALDKMFDAFDALVTYSAPGEAPEGQENGSPVFNRAWTILHVPCLNVPLATGVQGLPVGVQFIGRRSSDMRLLQIAERFWKYCLDSSAAWKDSEHLFGCVTQQLVERDDA